MKLAVEVMVDDIVIDNGQWVEIIKEGLKEFLFDFVKDVLIKGRLRLPCTCKYYCTNCLCRYGSYHKYLWLMVSCGTYAC